MTTDTTVPLADPLAPHVASGRLLRWAYAPGCPDRVTVRAELDDGPVTVEGETLAGALVALRWRCEGRAA